MNTIYTTTLKHNATLSKIIGAECNVCHEVVNKGKNYYVRRIIFYTCPKTRELTKDIQGMDSVRDSVEAQVICDRMQNSF